MAKDIIVTAQKINRRKKSIKIAKITSICILVFLTALFIILSLIFQGGKFVIQLNKEANRDTSLVIYEFKNDREFKRKLYADEVPYMDNISIKQIPSDIDTEKEGSHNGDNYIAYTFYVENTGDAAVNYSYEIVVDDVIKRVDEGIRIMIFLNGEHTIYAKINGDTKEPEPNTTPFYSNKFQDTDNIAVYEQRKNLTPNNPDRITVVVWIEGDDPDTVNALIGGEIKMHMNIREEHLYDDELKDDTQDEPTEDTQNEPNEDENVEENNNGDQ